MQAFSSTVRDMYALAEYAAPDQFLTQAINLLQMWIRFDGAIFGTGEGSQRNTLSLLDSSAVPPSTTVPETLMAAPDSSSEAESRFANDPVARGFRDAPFSPARGGVSELYRKSRDGKKTTAKELSGPRNLSEELGLYHLMVHGDDPKRVRPARWIVLYRKHDLRFADTDAACLHGLWIHLSRALAINRSRVYERQFGQEKSLGMASGLITQDGQVEIGDQRLFDLFEREWPESAPDRIPAHVMEILAAGKTFRGTQIEINLYRQNGQLTCRVRPVGAMEILSPREFVVARRFAAGMSHKQIARELGVSHHTVRNQLAHLYRKLNLHDKVSLAQYLATNAAPV
jgi:DNA-binding CsgD family transcriptional regulator